MRRGAEARGAGGSGEGPAGPASARVQPADRGRDGGNTSERGAQVPIQGSGAALEARERNQNKCKLVMEGQ